MVLIKKETRKKWTPILGMTRKIRMKNGARRKKKKKMVQQKKNGGTTSRPAPRTLMRQAKLLRMESMELLSHLMVLEILALSNLIRLKAVST